MTMAVTYVLLEHCFVAVENFDFRVYSPSLVRHSAEQIKKHFHEFQVS